MTRVNRWNDPASQGRLLWSAADEQRRKKRHLKTFAALGAATVLLIIVLLSSVGGAPTAKPGGDAADPEAFFDDAMFKLSRADDFIAVNLASEELILRQIPEEDPPALDKSGKKPRERLIVAIVTDDPSEEGKQYTIFQVPERAGNPRFKSEGIRPGDTIYYFAKLDEFGVTQDPYAKEHVRVYRYVNRPKAIKLVIRNVVDERTLRAIGGLNSEVSEPQLLEVYRNVYNSDLAEQKASFFKLREATSVNWQPSPDRQVLTKATADLNQWIHDAGPDIEWQIDSILKRTLSVGGPNRPLFFESIQAARLDQLSFDFHDARFIQEAVWLRDISRASRSETTDLNKARLLFDWTVRHIQLNADPSGPEQGRWNRPWQTLLYGHGTADERAWVFILLARQQGLNVVMLAHRDPDDPENLKFWLPALVGDGSKGVEPPLYLFDTRLGLPIAGPDQSKPATLADVLADPTLLDRLNVDGQPAYGTSTSDLKRQVVAFIEASPRYYSKRMKLLQSKLTGDRRLVLTHSAAALAQQLKRVDAIESVRLWPLAASVRQRQVAMPLAIRNVQWEKFRVFAWVPWLWRARMLNFREFNTPAAKEDPTEGEGHLGPRVVSTRARRNAVRSYLHCLKPDADLSIENIPAAGSWLIEKRLFDRIAKMQAAYWLALLHFDNKRFAFAANFFENRALKAYPGGPWQHGATYNLARTFEALGQPAKAIKLYRDDVDSPQRHGNLLRARRLEAALPPAPKATTEPQRKVKPAPRNPDPELPKAAQAGR